MFLLQSRIGTAVAQLDCERLGMDGTPALAAPIPNPGYRKQGGPMRYIILWALGVPVVALVALHLLGIL